MTLGNTILKYRKELGITQESLAKQLEVTNQAVSKWESDQCCPDVMLLPRLADIFDITIDELFGREPKEQPMPKVDGLPWEDDGNLRGVLFQGWKLIDHGKAPKFQLFCKNKVDENVYSDFSVVCGDVAGSVNAGSDVKCGTVMGGVHCGGDVQCENIGCDVNNGGDVTCTNVSGCVEAGGDVACTSVAGNIEAGGDVNCQGNVDGYVEAGGDITCQDVLSGYVEAGCDVSCRDIANGYVSAGGDVSCGNVGGPIDAGGDVTIKK